jgi:hypothetical protein
MVIISSFLGVKWVASALIVLLLAALNLSVKRRPLDEHPEGENEPW